MSGEWLALAGPPLATAFLLTLALALLTTGRALRRLRARAILDRPNERSSHDVPTPRGGGIGILAALLPAWLVVILLGYSDWLPLVAMLGALVLALVSWRDDVGGLSPALRLAVQALAVAVGLAVHLHPTVQVSLIQDGTAALLRLASGVGFRLRAQGAQMSLADSIYLGSGEIKKTQQIVLAGKIGAGPDGARGATVKWAIRREGKKAEEQ